MCYSTATAKKDGDIQDRDKIMQYNTIQGRARVRTNTTQTGQIANTQYRKCLYDNSLKKV